LWINREESMGSWVQNLNNSLCTDKIGMLKWKVGYAKTWKKEARIMRVTKE
jgi:hypothetical protein